MNEKVIEIKYRGVGLEKELSNLYPYTLELEGRTYACMEAFFSCLRTEIEWIKPKLMTLYGFESWKQGHKFNWTERQVVFYNNHVIDRHSEEYNNLITAAFDALYKNLDFKNALRKSKGFKLKHSMGKTSRTQSLLTRTEFIGQLNRLRNKLDERKFYNLFDSLGQYL